MAPRDGSGDTSDFSRAAGRAGDSRVGVGTAVDATASAAERAAASATVSPMLGPPSAPPPPPPPPPTALLMRARRLTRLGGVAAPANGTPASAPCCSPPGDVAELARRSRPPTTLVDARLPPSPIEEREPSPRSRGVDAPEVIERRASALMRLRGGEGARGAAASCARACRCEWRA